MRITVTGDASRRLPPELADLTLLVSTESGSAAESLERTSTLLRELQADIEQLAAPGADGSRSPLAAHAILPIATRSWRPWTPEGEAEQPRFAASATLRLTFREHRALTDLIARWGGREGVEAQSVAWSLPPPHQREAEAEVLAGAVQDATARARAIAEAAGFTHLTMTEAADVGLLGDAGAPAGSWGAGSWGAEAGAAGRAKMFSAADSGQGVDVTPEDIEVAVRIHARFEAS